MFLNVNAYCQSYSKTFEFSTFAGTALSFSKFTESHSKKYSTPPSFGLLYGIKLEKRILDSSKNINITTSYISQELSISSKFNFEEKYKTTGHTSVYLPIYDIWSLGIVKKFNFGSNFSFLTEIGEKLHFSRKPHNYSKYYETDYLDSIVTFNLKYVSQTNVTIIPYIGCGFSYQFKKFKIEAVFWAQRSFVPILKYNTAIRYGNSIFRSDILSYGMAIGGQLGLKLISF